MRGQLHRQVIEEHDLDKEHRDAILKEMAKALDVPVSAIEQARSFNFSDWRQAYGAAKAALVKTEISEG